MEKTLQSKEIEVTAKLVRSHNLQVEIAERQAWVNSKWERGLLTLAEFYTMTERLQTTYTEGEQRIWS